MSDEQMVEHGKLIREAARRELSPGAFKELDETVEDHGMFTIQVIERNLDEKQTVDKE